MTFALKKFVVYPTIRTCFIEQKFVRNSLFELQKTFLVKQAETSVDLAQMLDIRIDDEFTFNGHKGRGASINY